MRCLELIDNASGDIDMRYYHPHLPWMYYLLLGVPVSGLLYGRGNGIQKLMTPGLKATVGRKQDKHFLNFALAFAVLADESVPRQRDL
jgi:hypothetical protein